jgi:hypothetical protein
MNTMYITTAHLPRFCQALEDALLSGNHWLGFDQQIQLLSVYDLHYFKSADAAADFQWFHHQQQKEVTLLPVEALLGYVQEQAKELLRQGQSFQPIQINDEQVLSYHAGILFQEKVHGFEQQMDSHDWKQTIYEPTARYVNTTPISTILPSIQVSFLVEQLARFASTGSEAFTAVEAMVQRHWTGTGMEPHIQTVLSGSLLQGLFIHEHKTNFMTQKNLEYLQQQLKTAGFNESIFPALEQQLNEGKESFQLQDKIVFGNDELSAVLHFAKSKQEGSDMYFFNRYEATLDNQTIHATQTFFINNKGQNIDAKEAANLLSGRSVFKEITPKEGPAYKAWLKLDFSERDEYGNSAMRYFNRNYGFDLKEAVGRLNLKEMGNPEQMELLLKSLQRGDLTAATLVKGNQEIQVQITADPKFKTLKMYDQDGTSLFVPGAKQEIKYGKAPVEERRVAEGKELSVGDAMGKDVTSKKKDLMTKPNKDNQLIPKKRVRQNKGQGIA